MQGKTTITVRGYHLDLFAHVNNARYLEFLEEARWEIFEKNNITMKDFVKRGLSLVVANINISYKYPAGLGAVLVVETCTKKYGKSSLILNQRVFLQDSGLLVVDADVTIVFVDLKTGKSMEVTDDIKAYFFPESQCAV